MLFIGALVLVVTIALAYAGFVVSEELVGAVRTRSWIRSLPSRIVLGPVRGIREFIDPPPSTTRKLGGPPARPAANSSRRPVAVPNVAHARAQRSRCATGRDFPRFGSREAIQLLGAAFFVAKVVGWLDVDGLEEVESVGDVEGADALAAGELPPNPGDHYVDPYVRDGQIVEGHFRTNADATDLNNYSGPHGDHFRRLNGRG